MTKALFVFAATSLVSASTALAQHGGDIGLTLEGGRIHTNEITPSGFEPKRVFEAELGEDVPNFTDEPGYDTADPGPFAAGSGIGFNILDALRKWDGNDFDAISAETMTVAFAGGAGGNSRTTPATADTTVNGFSLSVASDGSWHRHLQNTLNSPASDGIYLLTLDLFSTESSVGNSDPYYIVFNQNDTEESHEAAVSFVESNVVPEPAGIALLGMAGMGLMARRRAGRVIR